jgi:hypothetical protein
MLTIFADLRASIHKIFARVSSHMRLEQHHRVTLQQLRHPRPMKMAFTTSRTSVALAVVVMVLACAATAGEHRSA